ncbi:MAG: hypothetical protein R6W77_13740 [Trueperaceae bacterium]
MVRLELLGAPRVVTDDGAAPLPATRVGCLLAIAAVEGDWVRRDRLLALLWPNDDEPTARANLRQLLQKTREPYRSLLERTPDAVRVLASSDVVDADLAEIDQRWNDVARLHRGPFLDAFTPRNADAFDDWAGEQRARYTARWSRAVERAFAAAMDAGNVVEAESFANLMLDRDPLDAAIATSCARALAALGATDDARALVARHLAAVEAAELEPLPEVERTLRALASGGPATRRAMNSARAKGPSRAGAGWALIGRTAELAQLDRWWRGTGRWLTIVAPGGMGKTTLALAWSSRLSGVEVSVDVVNVAGLDDPERVTRRALDALRRGSRDRLGGFAELLGDADHLLLVDAAEAIPADGLPFPAWLSAAPGLRLLVTSRRSWDHSDNETLPLAGLATVANETEASPAAQLLWHAARAVNETDGADDEGDAPPDAVERAVRHFGGWPLGLELVAGWARWLGRDAWLEALDSRPDELATDDRSAALIAASWEYLPEPRRAALTRLAGVPTPWTADDAAKSADVSPAALNELVAAGWISVVEDGFTIHPLLIQHAQQADPATAERVRERHAHRIATDIVERFSETGAYPKYTPATWPHLQTAWSYACEQRDKRLVTELLEPLARSLLVGCAYEALTACVEEASAALDTAAAPDIGRKSLERRLDMWRLALAFSSHDLEAGAALHDRILEDAIADDDRYALARLALFRSVASQSFDPSQAHESPSGRRDLQTAQREAVAGEALLEGRHDRSAALLRANLRLSLANAKARSLDIDGARREWERALAMDMRAGGPLPASIPASNLARIELWTGHFGRALALTARHMPAVLEAGSAEPSVRYWNLRGRALAWYGDTPAARTCIERATALCTDLGPQARRDQLRECLANLTELEIMEGRTEEAAALLERAGPEPWTFEHRARLALLTGDLDGAEGAVAAALDLVPGSPPYEPEERYVASIRAIDAEVRVRRSGSDAWPAVAAAITAVRDTRFPPDASAALVPAADWLWAAGEHDLARRVLEDVRAAPTTRHATRLDCTSRLDAWGREAPRPDAGARPSGIPGTRSVQDWLDEIERIGDARFTAERHRSRAAHSKGPAS